MQRGSLTLKHRIEGPDVWQFRWSEKGPHGKRVYRKRVIGTLKEYPDAEAARHAVAGLISEVNWTNLQAIAMTVAQLCSHFEQRELAKSNTWRSHSTKKAYARYLIHAPQVSDGYTALWERKRLDLTVEAMVLSNPKWHPLFTTEELEKCSERLRQYGYDVQSASRLGPS